MASRTVIGGISRVSASASASASASTSRAASTLAQSTPATPTRATAPQHLDFPPLTRVAPSHGIHVATLHLRAHHPTNLDLFTRFALHAAANMRIPTSGAASLPGSKELITVPKSPFVHKKAQENFERRTLRRAIKVFDSDREVLDLYLRYLKKNGIGGVGVKAYIHEFVEVGFGKGELKEFEGLVNKGEVEAAADELVKALGGGKVFGEEAKQEKKEEAKAEVKTEVKEEAKEEAKPEEPVAEAQPAEPKA